MTYEEQVALFEKACIDWKSYYCKIYYWCVDQYHILPTDLEAEVVLAIWEAATRFVPSSNNEFPAFLEKSMKRVLNVFRASYDTRRRVVVEDGVSKQVFVRRFPGLSMSTVFSNDEDGNELELGDLLAAPEPDVWVNMIHEELVKFPGKKGDMLRMASIDGMPLRDIAAMYGVSHQYISNVVIDCHKVIKARLIREGYRQVTAPWVALAARMQVGEVLHLRLKPLVYHKRNVKTCLGPNFRVTPVSKKPYTRSSTRLYKFERLK